MYIASRIIVNIFPEISPNIHIWAIILAICAHQVCSTEKEAQGKRSKEKHVSIPIECVLLSYCLKNIQVFAGDQNICIDKQRSFSLISVARSYHAFHDAGTLLTWNERRGFVTSDNYSISIV